MFCSFSNYYCLWLSVQREEEKLEGTCQLYAHKSTFKLIRGGNGVEKSYLVVAWMELLGWLDDGVSKSPKRGTV